MFIHIGGRKILPEKKIVGVFNVDTLRIASDSEMTVAEYDGNIKSVVVDVENAMHPSIVSSFTLMRRESIKDGIVWRRKND
jgi:hypothetical protein